MSLQIGSATAFRWRPTALPAQVTDLVRVRQNLAILANGYECGFSACWPPASRLILDLFVEEWEAAGRLDEAFARARRRFVAQAPALLTAEPDFPDDVPTAVLLAVAVEGTTARVAWIGGDVAILARGGAAVAQTTPHTLREQVRRERPEVDPDQFPNVVLRTIGRDEEPPDLATFDLVAGDTIVLLSKAAFRGPCVPVAEAASLAGEPDAAERLAERAFVDDDVPYAAVAVLRFS